MVPAFSAAYGSFVALEERNQVDPMEAGLVERKKAGGWVVPVAAPVGRG